MNTQAYIESGIIDEYCLGLLSGAEALDVQQKALLYPEIREAVELAETSLLHYAPKTPRPNTKNRTLEALRNLAREATLDLTNPPFINQYSEASDWNRAVQHLKPNADFGTARINALHYKPNHQLILAWVANELIEEGHKEDAFQESFLILEGACVCNLNGRIVRLRAGDFLAIPPDTHHSILNVQPERGPVKALIQRYQPVV
jgi:mannose-6-phosphate isomerase-like protein (cupin superfamily)